MSSLLLDPARAETRVEFSMAEAELAQHLQWRASATVFRAIEVTLGEAAAHPEVFVDDVHVRGDAVELSIRAAVADDREPCTAVPQASHHEAPDALAG